MRARVLTIYQSSSGAMYIQCAPETVLLINLLWTLFNGAGGGSLSADYLLRSSLLHWWWLFSRHHHLFSYHCRVYIYIYASYIIVLLYPFFYVCVCVCVSLSYKYLTTIIYNVLRLCSVVFSHFPPTVYRNIHCSRLVFSSSRILPFSLYIRLL